MAIVYVLAHFDDEYCAQPLIRQRVREGIDQRFIYVADYPSSEVTRTRRRESEALLGRLGVEAAKIVHLAAGAPDGAVYRHLESAFAALGAAVEAIGPVEGFVCTAWEGGHMDHDMCALMTSHLAQARGAPVEQISLYNGKRLGAPFLHGGLPLDENGPVTRVRSTPGEWAAWMSQVRFFPSQIPVWSTLWPAMFWTYARRGFGYQRLDPARTEARPHEGVLYYERMFGVPYQEVRAAAEAFRQVRNQARA
jgi:LmbE family N-acetylglucosaminyl deacetylase